MKKKKRKRPSLVYQVHERLRGLLRIGHSRHAHKMAHRGKRIPYIFSWGTYNAYSKICIRFVRWVAATHHCLWLSECRHFVPQYLELIISTCEPTTVRTYACALGKLFSCHIGDFGVDFPPRSRAASHKNLSLNWIEAFNPNKYPEAQLLSDASGVRTHEMPRIHPESVVVHEDGSVWLHNVKGKGGQLRDIPVLPEYWGDLLALRDAAAEAGRDRLLPLLDGAGAKHYVPAGMPVHQDRAIFAIRTYDRIARPVEEIPRKEQYHCRKDMAGIILDRAAMRVVSEALGHHRLGVTTRYLRTEFRAILALRKQLGLI